MNLLQQLRPWLEARGRNFASVVSEAAMLLGRMLMLGWEFVRPAVVLTLNVLLALILLFEEWGWRPLSSLIASLARFPWWARVELWIAGLPPYAALATLAVPSAILVPAKLLGVYFLATGHLISATLVIIAAKVASTALIARIFLLTKPALMQIAWFARAHDLFVPWKDALFERIRASWPWRYGRIVKWRVKNYMRDAWTTLRPRLEAAWHDVKPNLDRLGRRIRAAAHDLRSRVLLLLRRDPPRQLPPPDGRR